MSHALRCFSTVAVLLLAVCCLSGQTSKVSSVLDTQEFIEDWRVSKQFTLDVANAMPAESYNFKPNPDEMTFGEQIVHLAVANVFRFQQITGVQPPFPIHLSKTPPTDKQSATKILEQSLPPDYTF